MAVSPDFMQIVSSLDASQIVAIMVALGIIYAMVDFAVWAVREVAYFFVDARERYREWRWGN
jgi:flagellar biogenesis protein FliO